MKTPYRMFRSARKTLAVQITREGEVVVRAPLRLPVAAIEAFLAEKRHWIAENQAKQKALPPPKIYTAAEIAALKAQASAVLPLLMAHFAQRMGLAVPNMKITAAKKRFGSCSPQNTLCFSCFLMEYPLEAVEYVVVHELAHIIEKNHSAAFYGEIAKILPDYKARKAKLSRRTNTVPLGNVPE